MLRLLGGPISGCWAGPFRRGCAQGASKVVRRPSRTRTDLVGELGDTAWGFSRLRRYCSTAVPLAHACLLAVWCARHGYRGHALLGAPAGCAASPLDSPTRILRWQSIAASEPGISTRASRFCARLDSRAVEPLRGHCARGGLGWSLRGAAACGAVAAHGREWLYVAHSRRALVRRVVGRECRYTGAKACGWADSAVVSTSQFGMPPPTWWSYGLV